MTTAFPPLPKVLFFTGSPKEFSLYFHLFFLPNVWEIPFLQIINLS